MSIKAKIETLISEALTAGGYTVEGLLAEKSVERTLKGAEALDAIIAAEDAAKSIKGVEQGANVTVKVGRAETTRELSGVVLAKFVEPSKVEGKPGVTKIKVLTGEGATTELHEVGLSAIVSVNVVALTTGANPQ